MLRGVYPEFTEGLSMTPAAHSPAERKTNGEERLTDDYIFVAK
jgi:hypothetical protein